MGGISKTNRHAFLKHSISCHRMSGSGSSQSDPSCQSFCMIILPQQFKGARAPRGSQKEEIRCKNSRFVSGTDSHSFVGTLRESVIVFHCNPSTFASSLSSVPSI